MDRKKLLRNPLLWVVAGLLLYYAFSFLLDDTRGYTKITTSQALEQLASRNVTQFLVNGGANPTVLKSGRDLTCSRDT